MNTSNLDPYDRFALYSGSFLLPIALMAFLAGMALLKCFYDYLRRDIRDEHIYRFKRRGSNVDLEWCELPEDETPQDILDTFPPLYRMWVGK